ncbi:MAG: hypothetical protein ACI4MP_07900, partial [Candidatus Ventricola sp.]
SRAPPVADAARLGTPGSDITQDSICWGFFISYRESYIFWSSQPMCSIVESVFVRDSILSVTI